MASTIEIDERLAARASELGNHGSAREAVEAALREYVRKLERMKIVELFGTIEYEEDYDYKEMRRRG